jgi:predicted 3-demethylubiquinone-9 3-methyltransferase (glyoxalase superfamily)
VQTMQKITPFLWFEKDAEEAVDFYRSVFDDAEVLNTTRYMEGWPGPVGEVMTQTLRIANQEFTVLNGGAQEGFRFSPATSFVVNCETQEEIDHLWDRLSEGGEPNVCGWTTDRYGVTWQIVPRVLDEYLMDPDPVKVDRVMKVMLQMTKLEIKPLEDAYNQP